MVKARFWSLVCLALATTLIFLTAEAVAQKSKEWKLCNGEDGASREQQISGCTAIIGSGREAPKALAAAFKARGTAYFYGNEYDRAIRDYSEAIRLDPQNAEVLDNRCWTRATVGYLQDALKDCSEALRLRPNYAPTMDTLGFVYLKLGEFDRAIAIYTSALQIDPKSVYSLYGRGVAKLKKGDATGGNADIAASRAIKDVAEEMARYGIR